MTSVLPKPALRTTKPTTTAASRVGVTTRAAAAALVPSKIHDENLPPVAVAQKTAVAVSRRTEQAKTRNTLGELTNTSFQQQQVPVVRKAGSLATTATTSFASIKPASNNAIVESKTASNISLAGRRVPLANKTTSIAPAPAPAVLPTQQQQQILTSKTNNNVLTAMQQQLAQQQQQQMMHHSSHETEMIDVDEDHDSTFEDEEEIFSDVDSSDELDDDQGASDAMDIDRPTTAPITKKPAKLLKNVEDIDMYDFDDPQFCAEYVTEIFEYFAEKEAAHRIDGQYMDRQVDINRKHRTIMVDWMADVCVKFRLLTETFFLAVGIIDRFLQYKAVARQKFQLVGIASMLIASKYEEIYTPEVQDFIYITASAYTREELIKMEKLILVTLDFNLNVPTAIHFLRRFSKAAKSDARLHTLCKYLIELSLIEYKMVSYLPSEVAAAAVYISRVMTGISPVWNDTLEYYTGYSVDEILPCVRDLNALAIRTPGSPYQSIFKKYSSPKLLSVATIPVVDI